MPKIWNKFSKRKWVLLFLLILGGVFRLYNLSGTLQFLGDQGRDAMIVADIWKKFDLVFIGPVTSVGNMYLGPLYYYFMLPWLWLSYPSPLGPAYAVAVLGIITLCLMYSLGKKLIGEKAALIATFFYTFSQTVLIYTRFSWNPNPAPLISLLMIYFTHQAWQKNSWNWIWVVVSFCALLQLHYLTLLSAGGAGLIWLLSFKENYQQAKKKAPKKKLKTINLRTQLLATLAGIGIFLASLTPLMLFDAKHDWLNAKAFQKLIVSEENFKTTSSIDWGQKILKTLKETHGRGMHTLFEISLGQDRDRDTILLLITALTLIYLLSKKRKDKNWAGWMVISAYLITGILGTALYEHTIFDHYIAYLFPVTYWIYGVVLNFISKKWKIVGTTAGLIFGGYFLLYNLQHLPLKTQGWTITDMNRVSQKIYHHLKIGERYNLILFSESRDLEGQNYRYFLTTTNKPPLPREERSSAETLVIINEDRSISPQTLGSSPVYELVTFPDKTPKEVFEVESGPQIIILSTREDR